MVINYRELCDYCARYSDHIARLAEDVMLAWGCCDLVEAEEADRAQALVEATDMVVEDFFRDHDLLDDNPWTLAPNIVKGQPKNALCRKMRGY